MTTAEALIAAWVLLILLLAAIILLIMRGPGNSRR